MGHATLKLETETFQVFALSYGVMLLSRQPYVDDGVVSYDNVFMQGDDATDFLAEVDRCVENYTESHFIDSWLFEYTSIFNDEHDARSTIAELQAIGVTETKEKA
jgi:hypothetical protein